MAASVRLTIAAVINAVDPLGGGGTAVINVDLRQQPASGGFITTQIPASAIAAGTATIAATVDVIDGENGGAQSVVNVDLRQPLAGDYGSGGGLFSVEVPTANLGGLVTGPCSISIAVASGALTTGSCTIAISQ